MTDSKFKVGDIVKYSKPVDKKEEDSRFIVLDITPPEDGLREKLTVEFICDLYFKPINTFFSDEFVLAESK